MVFTAAIGLSPSFPVASTTNQVCRLPNPLARRHKLPITCSGKLPSMGNFHDPEKVMVFLNNTKEKLWQSIPVPLRCYPWKKAESLAMKEFLALGKETLKWSLLALYALSFLSDITSSVSRNKELMIPLGLFVGCLTASYLTEISRELVQSFPDGHPALQLVSLSCFFALLKIMAGFASRGRYFLLHIANGGLMQVIWNWMNLMNSEGGAAFSGDA